jgi:intein/homing endonuclease
MFPSRLEGFKPSKRQEKFLSLPTTIQEAAYAGGAGSGKALALDTIIPTSQGYKKIEDVHVGDYVYNHEGWPTVVFAESPIFVDHECFKVTLDSGIIITADADHLWVVHKNQTNRNKLGRYSILSTKQLFESKDKWSIIVSEPLKKENKNYPLDPYTLGAWLGDGSRQGAIITCADLEIVNRINQTHQVTEHNTKYSYGILKILEPLRNLNLLGNKHIPDLYFELEFDLRLALLQGLMDTDGTINASGTGIELSLSDERLAKDVLKLIYSLGIKASCTINKSVLNGKNYKNRYRIKFATKIPVFSLNRKVERHEVVRNISNNNTTRNKWHYIKSIEITETVPTKCLQVLGGIYLVTEACIPTHNTEILLLYGIIHKWHEFPTFKQLFLRRTYPEIRDEVWPRASFLYRKFGATPNQQSMTWTFPSGARIIFGHCENDNDVHRYDTTQINLFTPDEVTSLSEFIYLYISLQRVRTADSRLPAITRGAGMPGNIGHLWFKKRFVDPCKQGGKIIVGRAGRKRFFIHSTLADNPGIDPNYKQSLEAIPDAAERNAKLYGNFDAYQGQVFDEFRDRSIPLEPENAIHVIEPFEIPEWWPRIMVGDWGYAAMTYLGFFAISPSKRVYQYRELAWRKTKIEEWAPSVKSLLDGENIKLVKFCKSAGQERGQEHTIQQQISEALDREIELSNNSPGSRVAGKMLIHEYLRWKSKAIIPSSETPTYNDEHARFILRNKGLEHYKNYLAQFEPPEEEINLPKFQIFKCNEENHDGHPFCCPIMIDTIKACSYDKKRIEDIQEFNGDDPIDTLRYALDTVDSYFDEANDEFQKVQKQEQLIQRLQGSQNFTAFYNQSRALESNDRPRMISRYHRSR